MKFNKPNIPKSCFLGIFFLIIAPLNAITIPEGIRGFTVTYGTWIESVLSKSPLKDILFPEDQEQYDKLQRLIITSERLSEEGNTKEALSYLRRAEFYLQDLEKSSARKYGWTKTTYTDDEMAKWPENAREAWTMQQVHHINLYLQYEYFYVLNNTPTQEYFSYVQNALNLYYSLNKDSLTYKKLQNTSMPLYISSIESSWNTALQNQNNFALNQMIEYTANHINDFLSGSGYWKRKFLKRSIILLARFGYPEKSWYLMNHLMEDKSDSLPVNVNFNLMVYNSKYAEARNYILDNINTLNLNELDNWGIYINYEKIFLNMLLLLREYDKFYVETDKFTTQLKVFLQRIDLTTDIFEYISYQLNDIILTRKIVEVNQKPEQLETMGNINIFTAEFTSDEIKLKKNILESYSSHTGNFPVSNLYTDYRQFQLDVELHQLKKAEQSLNKLKKENINHVLTKLASLEYYTLAKEKEIGKEEWYNLWFNTVRDIIQYPPMLISIESGIIITFDIQESFFKFFEENKNLLSARELTNLLFELSIISSWNNKMLTPPDYFRVPDLTYRYMYLARWGFGLTENKFEEYTMYNPAHNLTDPDTSCPENNNCWILYPEKDTLYSLVLKQNKYYSLKKIPNIKTSMSLIHNFYKTLEGSGKNKDIFNNLTQLSENLKIIIEQIQNSEISDSGKLHLLAYKYANLFPIEALLFKDKASHLGDKYKIVRKLPVDLTHLFTCTQISCDFASFNENIPLEQESDHYFIGIGNTNPGFIIANPNLDEILDIEGLFSKKKLFSDSVSLSSNLFHSLGNATNYILHIAGEWVEKGNIPRLIIQNPAFGIELKDFRYVDKIPYLVFSKNKSNNFNENSYYIWEKVLTTFRYKNTRTIITSMALSPKEFRQAFFYDFYYKIEHKKQDWFDAFFSAMDRTKKGFPDSIWPYLMVVYEK